MTKILAQTFTPVYDEIEDRIKLIVNYQDFHNRVELMITRKFTIQLVPMLEEFYEKHYGDLQKSSSHNGNFKKYTSKTSYEDILLYKKRPLLLHGVKLLYKKPYTIANFKTESNLIVTQFNREALAVFTLRLKRAIPQAGWGLFL